MSEEILFRGIYQHIEIPIFILDVEGDGEFIISDLNPAYERATGLSKADAAGKGVEVILVEDEVGAGNMRMYCRQCLEKGVPVMYDAELRLPAGVRSFHISLIPVRNASSKIYRIIGVLQDITLHQQAKKELRESHDLLRVIIDAAPTAIIGLDLDGNVQTVWNRAAEKMLGWSAEEVMGKPLPSVPSKNQEEFRGFREKIRRGERLDGIDVCRQKRDGTPIHYSIYASPLNDTEGRIIGNIAVMVDITARKQIDNIMKARLRLLELANSCPMDDLLTATLDELEALTGSVSGFYHFLESDQKTLSLQNWSTNTLKNMCTASGKNTHYDIDRAGVWVDCVHQRRPVIHNDYASLPHRKGMPEGHAPVTRELVVPIFRGKQIKAIIGVGNKPTNYEKSDVEIVSQLGDLSWDIIERMLTEEALRRSEEEKTILNQIANIFLTHPDEAMYGEVLAIVLEVMRSKFGTFGYIGEKGELIIPSLTREIWHECQVSGKSAVFPADSWGNSLWGRAINEKMTFHSKGPFNTPEGHIHIDNFLTVPIIYGQEVIGLISVANKEGDYTTADRNLLERIVRYISPILNARLQRDIQEVKRRAAERDLRESEEKYRLLITNADEAIFIVQDEVLKFPNPRAVEMTGYSEPELTGIPIGDLIHHEDREVVFKKYLKLFEGEKRSEAYPFRLINKTGNEMWVQLTTAPIIWENRPGILCFLKDITIEKKLEAQFMQSQKMEAVGRLAGGVAHDFNNMLVVIMGHAELALRKVHPTDPLHGQLQKIEKAARRSANLTRQLLAFARKQTIAPISLDLNDTVSGMLNMLRRLIGEDIDLAWMPGAELWPVKMDPSQIDQILANLCVNSRDAISGVGKITIETGNTTFDQAYCTSHADFIPGEYVQLSVSDNGSGMDDETKKHVFEPFFTTKEVGKGTGLGLATVYGIIKQNNGFINIYSEPGLGTTIKIYFPRHHTKPTESAMDTTIEVHPGGNETILIVEDEQEILDLGKKVLDELGYKLLTARTPGEAIRMAKDYTGDIHLLFTDVVMPEMNGRELAERLTSIKPGLKCLYMSGYTSDIIAHQGVLKEGVQFIQKPFSVKDLAVKVRMTLDMKPAKLP